MLKRILVPVILVFIFAACAKNEPAILVFSETKGFRHQSITEGKAAFLKLGKEQNFRVDTTESSDAFTEKNLKQYDAVVFLSTTGDVLTHAQQNDFMRYIQAGGGFLGIHAAADTEYDWWWYNKLVGAYFLSHPEQQEAVLKKTADLPDNSTSKLPESWKRKDEWYNYRRISPAIKVLYNLDESSYKGGTNGSDHPIIWYQNFDGGRSFYIGIGHTNESYTDTLFLDAVSHGLKFAMGNGKLDYSKVHTERVPEENRFDKVVLKYYLDEPTEMTILPDGRIIFLERKGNVKLYNPSNDSLSVINTFNVWTKSEDGMIGLTRDPDFEKNHWLYLFYAHPEKSVNRLSRFEFKNNRIDMSSEKHLLDVPVQRQTCCHTGGSLTFGANGDLYISTGDNTNPFESDGYSPSDDRPGRSPFDARGSSANTNDLRGKILRIHPQPDGTYTIPEGNLFAKGEALTKPEIYTMGLRNPYRISVDQRRGYLYWGEVGPDAGNDSETRGPRGYDEVNLAKGPGFFGWPLFIGGNYPYAEYDFDKKTVAPGQNPAAPKNTSKNNTGKVDLPPLQQPFIYYPYAETKDFPLMGTGGRNAMAGPVYYADNFKDKPGAFPTYFNGKLIIYEWMRGWIRLVTLNDDASIFDIEPFMANVKFNNPIDMEFGPDGKLYVLEYGTKWFGHNEDARLVRIDWNSGNRPPVANLKANQSAGVTPLKVNFSASDSQDPDGGQLKYELLIGESKLNSADGTFNFTFDQPGVYRPKLTITDPQGLSSTAELVVIAGNAIPEVAVSVSGNQTYYFPGASVNYKVSVVDKEDGSTSDGKIKTDAVDVTVDFVEQGYDKTIIAQGHQRPNHPGQILIAESDCKSCHLIDQKSAGPAYRDIAKKYKDNPKAIEILAAKVIKGGSGVWGDVAMSAHPQITVENAAQMVSYILSLAEEKQNKLGLTGSVSFDKQPAQPNPKSNYVITASYEDNGSGKLPPLGATGSYILRAPFLTADNDIEISNLRVEMLPMMGNGFVGIKDGSSVTFKNVDLTSVKSITFNVVELTSQHSSGMLEIYLDHSDGKKLGSVDFSKIPGNAVQSGILVKAGKITFTPVAGNHSLAVRFRNPAADKNQDMFIFVNGALSNK